MKTATKRVAGELSKASGNRHAIAAEIQGLSSVFTRSDGSTVLANDGLDLSINEGDFVVLIGPSGCGKTTLLRSIAGLNRPDKGRISIDGRPMYDSTANVNVPPERRPLSMMFQSYALWPHMTIGENVAYPLKFRGVGKAERSTRAKAVLDSMGLAGLGDQYAAQLSGGQQQRAALARAIVAGEKMLLFDEPLSNVDAKVRDELRDELLAVQERFGFTAIYVTHDQVEAMALATRVVVLDQGRIAQQGKPGDVYLRPASLGVGRFLGKLNEFSCSVLEASGQSATIDLKFGRLTIPNIDGLKPGTTGFAISRPEFWRLGVDPADPLAMRAQIRSADFLGMHSQYIADVLGFGDPVKVRIHALGPRQFAPGDITSVAVDPAKVTVVRS